MKARLQSFRGLGNSGFSASWLGTSVGCSEHLRVIFGFVLGSRHVPCPGHQEIQQSVYSGILRVLLHCRVHYLALQLWVAVVLGEFAMPAHGSLIS